MATQFLRTLWLLGLVLWRFISSTSSGIPQINQYRLKNASLELTFDYNSRFGKSWASNKSPFLLLSSPSTRLAVHLNENEFRITQFEHDKTEYLGGHWRLLLSTTSCINRNHPDLFYSQQNVKLLHRPNVTRYYLGIRNKHHIAVCINELTVNEPIYGDIYPKDESIRIWFDPTRRGSVSNLDLNIVED